MLVKNNTKVNEIGLLLGVYLDRLGEMQRVLWWIDACQCNCIHVVSGVLLLMRIWQFYNPGGGVPMGYGGCLSGSVYMSLYGTSHTGFPKFYFFADFPTNAFSYLRLAPIRQTTIRQVSELLFRHACRVPFCTTVSPARR